MVIDNFNIVSVSVQPTKTDPPLIVDSNAVLALAIALQRLEPVTRRHEQILNGPGMVEIQQFSPRRSLDRPKPRDQLIVKKRLRIARLKGLDHADRVLRVS